MVYRAGMKIGDSRQHIHLCDTWSPFIVNPRKTELWIWVPVFVHSWFCDKVRQTGWLINNTRLFLQCRGWKLELGVQAGQVRALCQVADFSVCAHVAEGVMGAP